MAECTFVVTIGRGAEGIAKLVDITSGIGVIEFFDSPSGPRLETNRVPLTELRRIELATQTRVFRLDPATGGWSVGRVDGGLVSGEALGKREDHYHVRFPNGHDERVPISQLFVRRNSPVEDPTEYLAAMITDTPFFFDGRSRIVRHLANQRRLFGGLTGLASSAIELLEHQVLVVRKVLSDPIQRYLLADEVGLGKTIEAGVLIRQHLLDHPDEANVLIIVPDHLVLQWRKELRTKFYIYVEDERVRVAPLSSLLASDVATDHLSLFVIDEAHISAEWAFNEDPAINLGFFKIRDIAQTTQRVLLLSGTPVLYREKEFLAMLHLLDPQGYRLSDVDSFRKRIEARQTVAEAIVDFSDEANGMFVEDALNRIQTTFSSDPRTIQLCTNARELLWEDVSSPARSKALRELRGHIREAYKLDRRILRSRRGDRSLRNHLPVRTGATIVEWPDLTRLESVAFLEAWRLSIDDLSKPLESARSLFAEFVECAIAHPRHLVQRIDRRIETLSGSFHPGNDLSDVEFGDQLQCFEGELELLEEWKRRIATQLDSDVRSDVLSEWLKKSAQRKKHILFVSDSEIADVVALAVQSSHTPFNVIRYNGKFSELREFERATEPVVLVCDRRSEEGLNLQRAGAVLIHYDLPLDPSRIEQRIGRVDRIEARGHVSNVILATKNSYESPWIECLTGAVGVFDRSIAPLQFLLSTVMATTRFRLVTEGGSAFHDASQKLQDPLSGAQAELKRIDAQEEIDSAEAAVEQDAEFFQRLVEGDERIAEVGKSSLDAWLVKRLGFHYQRLEPEIGRYVHNLDHTLVPAFEALRYFDESLDRTSHEHRRKHEMPLLACTFHRDIAEVKQVPLLRVGNALVDALERFVRDDPRGMAFGVWRTVPLHSRSPQAFFRFDFYVQARLDQSTANEDRPYSLHALRRRADTLFPVLYETIWLDSDMDVLSDPETLEMVERGFSKDRRADASFDTNLSSARWREALLKLEISDWAGLCTALRIVAEDRLKESERYRSHQFAAMERFRHQAEQRANIYASRMAMLDEAARMTERQLMAIDLELDEVVRLGMVDPSIRVDSIGCVITAAESLEPE